MEDSGPHKHSILRNKEVPKKNAPHKPRDVTRPTLMVKRYGFRGTLSIKYKIDFWNNPITASVLVWNQVVLNQSQQLGYLNSKLMLSWDCPFKHTAPLVWARKAGGPFCPAGPSYPTFPYLNVKATITPGNLTPRTGGGGVDFNPPPPEVFRR